MQLKSFWTLLFVFIISFQIISSAESQKTKDKKEKKIENGLNLDEQNQPVEAALSSGVQDSNASLSNSTDAAGNANYDNQDTKPTILHNSTEEQNAKAKHTRRRTRHKGAAHVSQNSMHHTKENHKASTQENKDTMPYNSKHRKVSGKKRQPLMMMPGTRQPNFNPNSNSGRRPYRPTSPNTNGRGGRQPYGNDVIWPQRPNRQPYGNDVIWPQHPNRQPYGNDVIWPQRPNRQPYGNDVIWPQRPNKQPYGNDVIRPQRPNRQPYGNDVIWPPSSGLQPYGNDVIKPPTSGLQPYGNDFIKPPSSGLQPYGNDVINPPTSGLQPYGNDVINPQSSSGQPTENDINSPPENNMQPLPMVMSSEQDETENPPENEENYPFNDEKENPVLKPELIEEPEENEELTGSGEPLADGMQYGEQTQYPYENPTNPTQPQTQFEQQAPQQEIPYTSNETPAFEATENVNQPAVPAIETSPPAGNLGPPQVVSPPMTSQVVSSSMTSQVVSPSMTSLPPPTVPGYVVPDCSDNTPIGIINYSNCNPSPTVCAQTFSMCKKHCAPKCPKSCCAHRKHRRSKKHKPEKY